MQEREQNGVESSSSSADPMDALSPRSANALLHPALSDSMVPTLAMLSLQEQQQSDETADALVPSAISSPGPLTPLQEVLTTSSPTPPTPLTLDAIVPAANSDALSRGTTTAGPSSSGTSTSTSIDAESTASNSQHSAASIAAIKARDFAASASQTSSLAGAPLASSASSIPAASSSRIGNLNSSSTLTSNASTLSVTPSASSTSSNSGSNTPIARSTTPSARPGMPTSSSTSTIRRQPGVGGQGPGLAARIPPSLQAKMAAMASRSNNPTQLQFAQTGQIGASERIPTSAFSRQSMGSSSSSIGGNPQLVGQSGPGRPAVGGAPGRVGSMGPMGLAGRTASSPVMGGAGGLKLPGAGGGLAKRRGPAGGLNLANMAGGAGSSNSADDASPTSNGATGGGINGRAGRPQMRLPSGSGGTGTGNGQSISGAGTPFSNFSKIVDPSGSLNFENKAVLHAKGVDFSTGASFSINMDELELQDELGSGNYGTVQKVFHKTTKVTMAMKEIRLELDDSKLKGIITELDVLHRAVSPEIVEFYGAFFIESCVYYCMEYMDAGSLDRLAVIPVPEPVLKRVTASMVRGLKFLKDKLQIMHRDVKPTNVLMNTAGMVKLCDFGVSGQLERSLAKTNIGCQSYMAPERIKGESQNFLGTYTVSSDVWSLGLTVVEFTLGRYPYPPETYSNVFAQLTAIVHGDPPALPDGFSKEADDFVAQCLQKDAKKRPTYAQLLRHPFLADEEGMDINMTGWVKEALEFRSQMRNPGSSSAPTGTTPNATLPVA